MPVEIGLPSAERDSLQVTRHSLIVTPDELRIAKGLIERGAPLGRLAKDFNPSGAPVTIRLISLTPDQVVTIPVRVGAETASLEEIQSHPMTGAISIKP